MGIFSSISFYKHLIMPDSPLVLRNAVGKFKRFVSRRRTQSQNSLSVVQAPEPVVDNTPLPEIRTFPGRGRQRTTTQRCRSQTFTHDDTPPKLEKRLSSFFDNYYSNHPLSRSQTERYFDSDLLPEPRQRYHVPA